MQIAKNRVATINYTLTDEDSNVIDASTEGEPFAYIQGNGNIIPGLEAALEGKVSGDAINVSISPEQAYGERNDEMVQTVPRNLFEDIDDLQAGMQFQAQSDEGMQVVTIVDVADDDVTVDGNHPLAGKTLNFDVTILDVREATEEELSHGHAHGEGGHQH